MSAPHDVTGRIETLAAALPPFPAVVAQLLDMLRDENASLDVMVRLARNDIVIAANILATANRLRRISAKPDLHDPFVAASLIGLNQVRRIVVAIGMNKFIGDTRGGEFLASHSRAVAIVAQELAMLTGVSPEKAYIAGILHDMGQLCFHILAPEAFQDAYRSSATDGRLLEREAEIFGLDHARAGALLAEHWHLPEDFVLAIATHHDNAAVTSKLQAVVNLAESIARALDIPPSAKNRLSHLNQPAVEALEIRWCSPEMADCLGRCRARFRHAASQSTTQGR